jgi:hypothetical protein
MPLDVVSSEDSVVNLEPLSFHGNGNSSAKGSGLLPWSGNTNQANSATTGGSDKMAEFLADLMADLSEGATIELLATDGRKYVPKQLARGLCDSARLAFSAKTDDGTHSLVVLPWPSIARIEIRGLKQLPLEFRD